MGNSILHFNIYCTIEKMDECRGYNYRAYYPFSFGSHSWDADVFLFVSSLAISDL
jgi:hypothetical protein